MQVMVASYEVSIQESALLYVAETYKTLYPEGILIFSCQNPVSPAVMFFWEAVLNTKKFLVESRSPFCRQMIESYFYILCDARIYDPPVIPKHRFLADVGISVRHYNRDVHIAFRGIGNDCDIVLNGINTGILVGTSFQVTILRCYSQINTHSKT